MKHFQNHEISTKMKNIQNSKIITKIRNPKIFPKMRKHKR